MSETPKKVELAHITVSGNVGTLTLNGPALAAGQLKDLVTQNFRTNKSTLELSLELKNDISNASTTEKEFLVPKVATRIQKLGDYLKGHVDAKPNDYEDIVQSSYFVLVQLKRFPILPIPVVASKLYLLIRREPTKALLDSWDVIRHFQLLVDELSKDPVVDKAGKRKVMQNREQTLDSMIDFVSNTFSRLFVLPQDDELTRIVIRENYYSTINVIRIWEFTLLDLLGIPQRLQSSIVTTMEYDAKMFESTTSFDPEILPLYMDPQNLLKSFLSFYDAQKRLDGSKTIAENKKEDLIARASSAQWPTLELGRLIYDVVRHTTSNVLFYCGNHEICQRHEDKINQFNKCARCRWVRYCSRECQVLHWQTKHKTTCMQKVDSNGIEEVLKGRRIIISTEDDDLVTKKSNAPAKK